jgi:plastocyanin
MALRLSKALAAATLVAAVSGCGASAAGQMSPPSSAPTGGEGGAARAAVTIKGYAFKAKSVTVTTGGRVTFTNLDADKHTATATTPGDQAFFDTSGLRTGQSKAVTFKEAGTYPYYCAFHPFMKGTVVVRSAGAGA